MKCFEILNIAFCQYVSITLTGVTSLGVVCWQFWASSGGTKEQGDCTLRCGASGRGPDKLHASFAGKGGKMPALLSSELSTCLRAVWQHVAEQLSGGVAVTPPGRPTGKNCCCQTRLNPRPFPQGYWLHTILRGSFVSPGADLVLEKQMMTVCGLRIPCSSSTSSTTTKWDLYPMR